MSPRRKWDHPPKGGGGRSHLLAGEGVGKYQFRRLEKNLWVQVKENRFFCGNGELFFFCALHAVCIFGYYINNAHNDIMIMIFQGQSKITVIGEQRLAAKYYKAPWSN
jgi:hypothetical protein